MPSDSPSTIKGHFTENITVTPSPADPPRSGLRPHPAVDGCARNEGQMTRGTMESGVRRAQSGRAHSTTAMTAITMNTVRIVEKYKRQGKKSIFRSLRDLQRCFWIYKGLARGKHKVKTQQVVKSRGHHCGDIELAEST
jgi:hypothetical protein